MILKPAKIAQTYFQLYELNRRPAVLHISGEDGAGKTALLIELINFFWEENQKRRIYIFDSEKKFTKKRMIAIKNEKNRIFVQNLRSADQLFQNLSKSSLSSQILDGSLLIIHSFSALLREDLAFAADYAQYLNVIHAVKSQIFPRLLSLAVKNRWHLILTHHVAYDPEFQENRPAFHALLENINGMWWFLQKIPVSMNDENKEITYRRELRVFARFFYGSSAVEKKIGVKNFRAKIPLKNT